MSSYIGRININNTLYPIAQSLFGTCDTTANTATKVVTCADFDTLISGIVINVYFTYANTNTSISLNVNSTGNKDVYTDSNSSISWEAGATKSFVYYNNKWRLVNPTSVGTTYSAATTAAAGLMSATDKIKLNSIASSAEVNQNAFSNVIVGSSTVLADSKTDSLTLVGSGSVSLTANTSTDTITISGTNTTYSAATTAAAGLMSADDKKKLNSVASSATYNLAFKTVKVGTTDLVADVVDDTLTITAGNNITLTPTASSDSFSIAATNTTYAIATTAADGLMSASDKIKLNGVPTSVFKTIKVGSTNLVADSALDTLTITAGDNITLTPTASSDSFSISATNTTYGTVTSTSNGLMSAADKQALDNLISDGGLPNQNAFSNIVVGSSTVAADQKTDSVTFVGSGSITLTANTSTDTITFSGTNTTYSNATTATAGLMSTTDKIKLNSVASSAEVNQNAFSNVVVGSSTVAADVKTDTLTLVGDGSVSLSANTSTDTITISGTNTTYGNATTAAAGLMSAADKLKVDGLSEEYVPIQHIGSISTATINYLSNIIKVGTQSTWSGYDQYINITQGEYPRIDIGQAWEDSSDPSIYHTSGITMSSHFSNIPGIIIYDTDRIVIGTDSTSGVYILHLKDPINDEDAANKRYVDSVAITSVATTATNGLMSATDKAKLDSLDSSSSGGLTRIKILSTDTGVSQVQGQPNYVITHNLGTLDFSFTVWVQPSSSDTYRPAVHGIGGNLQVSSDSNIYYNLVPYSTNTTGMCTLSFSESIYAFKLLLDVDSSEIVNGDSLSYGGN